MKISGYGVNSGRGVYATNDLVKGTYVSLETVVHRVYVNALSTYTIELYSDYFDNYRELEKITNYMYGYGFETDSKVRHHLLLIYMKLVVFCFGYSYMIPYNNNNTCVHSCQWFSCSLFSVSSS